MKRSRAGRGRGRRPPAHHPVMRGRRPPRRPVRGRPWFPLFVWALSCPGERQPAAPPKGRRRMPGLTSPGSALSASVRHRGRAGPPGPPHQDPRVQQHRRKTNPTMAELASAGDDASVWATPGQTATYHDLQQAESKESWWCPPRVRPAGGGRPDRKRPLSPPGPRAGPRRPSTLAKRQSMCVDHKQSESFSHGKKRARQRPTGAKPRLAGRTTPTNQTTPPGVRAVRMCVATNRGAISSRMATQRQQRQQSR